jgi:hypothetical protein
MVDSRVIASLTNLQVLQHLARAQQDSRLNTRVADRRKS